MGTEEHSMFLQQFPPHSGQQANTRMYNNTMNINVSTATNTGGLSNKNQMTGQMSMTSVTSVPTSGLSSMGPEQINDPTLRRCNLFPNQVPGMDTIKQEERHLRNTADPGGAVCVFLQPTGLTNIHQSEELHLFVLPHLTCHQFTQDTADSRALAHSTVHAGLAATGRAASPNSLQLDSTPTCSLFAVFTVVQLRSLLKVSVHRRTSSPFRLRVFEENHTLVLFLFSSRQWFLALFSVAIQCKRLESYLEERKEF